MSKNQAHVVSHESDLPAEGRQGSKEEEEVLAVSERWFRHKRNALWEMRLEPRVQKFVFEFESLAGLILFIKCKCL